MELNFRHLRSFHAVALERSVSRAARRLNISQPTLSKQIKALEERYKLKLIEGNRPPLSLTPAGKALLEKTRLLFEAADEIGQFLGAEEIGETTLLRIGTDSPPYAAEFLSLLAARQPHLNFRVTVANAAQTSEALTNAQIDIGIICEPIIRSDYSYLPLYTDRLVAIAPAAKRDLPDPVSIARLMEETLLLREGASRTQAMIDVLLAEAGGRKVTGRILHTREMIREGVAQGLGVSMMFARECPPDPRIRVLAIDAPTVSVTVHGYLAVSTERKRQSLVRQAISTAAEMLALSRTDAADDATGKR